MAIEIERKFLVKEDSWRNNYTHKEHLRQGYFKCSDCTLRVRVSERAGWLTIKGRSVNISRSEFEYSIPKEDAEKMLSEFVANNVIEKVRYFVNYKGSKWIVDEFLGANQGLVLAEIELDSEDADYEKPSWLGEEVSKISRYNNSSLAQCPYSKW